jgi:glutathione S-transferase
LRFWLSIVGEANLTEQQRGQIMAKRVAGCEALRLMDEHLGCSEWMAGDRATLADIALFPYTHVAEEGGFGLEDYPEVCRWIEQVRKLPGFVAMA